MQPVRYGGSNSRDARLIDQALEARRKSAASSLLTGVVDRDSPTTVY
jgi:hypothetical protein